MKALLSKISTLIQLIIPRRLPKTDAEMTSFVQLICDLGGFPLNDSMIQSVAVMLQHLAPLKTFATPLFFVLSLHKAMINQAAFNAIQDVRQRAKEASEKAKQEADRQVV